MEELLSDLSEVLQDLPDAAPVSPTLPELPLVAPLAVAGADAQLRVAWAPFAALKAVSAQMRESSRAVRILGALFPPPQPLSQQQQQLPPSPPPPVVVPAATEKNPLPQQPPSAPLAVAVAASASSSAAAAAAATEEEHAPFSSLPPPSPPPPLQCDAVGAVSEAEKSSRPTAELALPAPFLSAAKSVVVSQRQQRLAAAAVAATESHPSLQEEEGGGGEHPALTLLDGLLNRVPTYTELPLQASLLTTEQNRRYIALCALKKREPPPMPAQEQSELLYLESLVVSERDRYRKHFFDEAVHNKACFHWIHKENEEIIERDLQRKREISLALPRYYRTETEFVLARNIEAAPGVAPAVLRHLGHVFEVGTCALFQRPTTPCTLPLGVQKAASPLPPIADDPVVRDWVIGDPNSVAVAIGASALAAIFDVWGPREPSSELMIPLKVSEIRAGRRTLLFGKPLLPGRMTAREKNALVFKQAVSALGVREQQPGTVLHHLSPSVSLHAESMLEGAKKPGDTVLYNMWDLGDIRMLVRCRAYASATADPASPFLARAAKLHYCTANGRLDAPTESEAARWMLRVTLLPRRASQLVLGHVDALSGKLVKVEELQLGVICHIANLGELGSYLMMHRLFSELRQLSEGAYVLRRQPSSAPTSFQFTVFRETDANSFKRDDASFLDLHETQRNAAVTDRSALDFCIPAWRDIPGRVPFTFPPRSIAKQTSRAAPDLAKPGETFCHVFALRGYCNKKNCPFPHLAITDAQRSELLSQLKDKGKGGKGKKKKDSKPRKKQQKQQQGGMEHKTSRPAASSSSSAPSYFFDLTQQ